MNTQHKEDCKMVFGRKDPTCPRCQELLAGAKPREGWQQAYYSNKAKEEGNFQKRLQEHDCKQANCHPSMCTAFDW